jgi:hypothetical protein
VKRVQLKSKNLLEVGWDPISRTLDVVFVNAPDWVYPYQHVGMLKFVRLLTAESHGRYFARAIRSRPDIHPYTKRKLR